MEPATCKDASLDPAFMPRPACAASYSITCLFWRDCRVADGKPVGDGVDGFVHGTKKRDGEDAHEEDDIGDVFTK